MNRTRRVEGPASAAPVSIKAESGASPASALPESAAFEAEQDSAQDAAKATRTFAPLGPCDLKSTRRVTIASPSTHHATAGSPSAKDEVVERRHDDAHDALAGDDPRGDRDEEPVGLLG